MHDFKRAILCVLVALVGLLSATCGANPWACWERGCEITGEYLFLRPHQCDLNYVIVDSRSFGTVTPIASPVPTGDLYLPSGDERGICPEYTSAFRVGLGYTFNCGHNDITATYERLDTGTRHSRGSATVPDNGGLWIVLGHPRYENFRLNNAFITDSTGAGPIPGALDAFAEERVRILYNTVDGIASMRHSNGCTLWMRGFVGLRWSEFLVHQEAFYQGTITQIVPPSPGLRIFQAERDLIKNSSYTWGIGPRIGCDVRYALLCGFGIGAHVGASILAGESHHSIFQHVIRTTIPSGSPTTFDVDQTSNVDNRSHCILFPEVDARLGINYLLSCGTCFSLMIELGWEFVSYVNAIGRIGFNDFAGTNREACESFNIDGLYLSVKLDI